LLRVASPTTISSAQELIIVIVVFVPDIPWLWLGSLLAGVAQAVADGSIS
jgi:hypothetical protein